MAQQTVDPVVQGRILAFYDAMVEQDLESIVEMLDSAFELHNPLNAVEPGVRRGQGAAMAALNSVFEVWNYTHIEVVWMARAGEDIVVDLRVRGRASGSGLELDQHFGHVLRFRDDKLALFRWFHRPEEALKAVRLSKKDISA
jgi:ketosteroid isomerase-like protein